MYSMEAARADGGFDELWDLMLNNNDGVQTSGLQPPVSSLLTGGIHTLPLPVSQQQQFLNPNSITHELATAEDVQHLTQIKKQRLLPMDDFSNGTIHNTVTYDFFPPAADVSNFGVGGVAPVSTNPNLTLPIETQPTSSDLVSLERQSPQLTTLIELENQFNDINSKVVALMKNLRQNIIDSNGVITQNVLEFVEERLTKSRLRVDQLRAELSAVLDAAILNGLELLEWERCSAKAGEVRDVIDMEMTALQYCRVSDPTNLPPLAVLTIEASPLPLATSEEQHLPGPVVLCLRNSELAEIQILSEAAISIVYTSDACTSSETTVQHSAPRPFEKDGRFYIQFDRIRIMKPTRLQSVHFKFSCAIAQKVLVHRQETRHTVESKPTLPIIVMANTGKQWRKAYYKLLEYYVFQERAIDGCGHNVNFKEAIPLFVSTVRFFNCLEILINSVARHCNYSSHKHANTAASQQNIFNPFCPAELDYLKSSLFEDDLPSADSKKNKQPKSARGKKRKSALSEKTKDEDLNKEKVDRKRMSAFWSWFGCSFHNLRDRDKNLPLYVEGKVLFVSKEQANSLLLNHPIGTSIIRFSRQKPDLFSIAWVAGRRNVRHYLMKEKHCNKNLATLIRTKPKFSVFSTFLAVDRTSDGHTFHITNFENYSQVKKETNAKEEDNLSGYDAHTISNHSVPPINGQMWEKIQQHPLWNQLCKDINQ